VNKYALAGDIVPPRPSSNEPALDYPKAAPVGVVGALKAKTARLAAEVVNALDIYPVATSMWRRWVNGQGDIRWDLTKLMEAKTAEGLKAKATQALRAAFARDRALRDAIARDLLKHAGRHVDGATVAATVHEGTWSFTPAEGRDLYYAIGKCRFRVLAVGTLHVETKTNPDGKTVVHKWVDPTQLSIVMFDRFDFNSGDKFSVEGFTLTADELNTLKADKARDYAWDTEPIDLSALLAPVEIRRHFR
jgi:hypothetical protein